jgi:hypothetical protein
MMISGQVENPCHLTLAATGNSDHLANHTPAATVLHKQQLATYQGPF